MWDPVAEASDAALPDAAPAEATAEVAADPAAPGRGWARGLLVPLALAAALVCADLTLTRIYNGLLASELLAGAAFAAVAVSLVARRLPSWSVAPLSVLALTGYTALALRLSAAAGDVHGPILRIALDAMRNAIPRMLTTTIPIETQPDTIVVPLLATWLAGLAGAELALRSRRVLLGYAPATALYLGALYLVGPNDAWSEWYSVGFAACVATGLAASADSAHGRASVASGLSWGQRARLRARVGTGAAAGLAIVVGLVAAVGPPVAGLVAHRPSDPRRYVTPPQLDSLDENPLAHLSAWAAQKDQELFQVAISGLPGGTGATARIRLAVLSDYDGATWRVGASYRNAGRVLTGPAIEPAPGAPTGPEVTQRITINTLAGRLVPAMAAPQRIDGVRIAFDPQTGTVAYPEGLYDGLTYTVRSREPVRPREELLAGADVESGDALARFLSVGTSPPSERMQALATELAKGQAGPYQKAVTLQQYLTSHYGEDTSTSGHALANLDHFLFGLPSIGGQKGSTEQFAAAFAVLGRMMGLPTRVGVGFDASSGTVRGLNAYAWGEVRFKGLGWVYFDLRRPKDSERKPITDDVRPKPPPSVPPPVVVPTLSVPVGSRRPSSSAPAAAAGTHKKLDLLIPVGAGSFVVLALLVFTVTVPLLRRAQRRRRLYSGQPPDRVTGAWYEVLDTLRLAGSPAPAHLSAHEVAVHAAQAAEQRPAARGSGGLRPPAPSLDDLALLVNVASFAPHAPVEHDAERATTQAVAYIDDLRARRSRWRRLLWTLDPRPLRWTRRR